jgi:hypothetical protein
LETLLPFFRKLIATQNYYDAINAYKAIIQELHRIDYKFEAPQFSIFDPSMKQFHIDLLQSETAALVSLIRGLRKSNSSRQFILHLLTLIPNQQIRRDPLMAAEMLRYAGYWNNRSLVQKALDALEFPFYNESHSLSLPQKRYDFHEDLWSAILYAHVYVGLFDASRSIIPAMQREGLAPRVEDMSNIVGGVAKWNLDNGYELAVKLEEMLDVSAYETLLELALEQNHTVIVMWAKRLIASETSPNRWMGALGIQKIPTSFKMESELSITLTSTTGIQTARGVGAIIKHTAETQGVETAVRMLVDLSSSMTFSRDVYDKLYHIACDSESFSCGMWLASELRERGWMPRKYRELKWKNGQSRQTLRQPKYRTR